MGVDDLFNTESAVVAAATAAVCSPRARETLRRGVVLGMAGALKVGDVVAGAARGAARGVRGAESDAAGDGASGGDAGTLGEDGDTPTGASSARRAGGSRSRRSAGESES
jgi:hypothetical protein